MATKKTNTTQAQDQDLRKSLAYEAAGEIEGLLGMLRREIANDGDQVDMIVGTTLRRIKALNSVVLSVLGDDDGRDTAEMYEVVCGEPMEASHG